MLTLHPGPTRLPRERTIRAAVDLMFDGLVAH
jgi:hypothetical protein